MQFNSNQKQNILNLFKIEKYVNNTHKYYFTDKDIQKQDLTDVQCCTSVTKTDTVILNNSFVKLFGKGYYWYFQIRNKTLLQSSSDRIQDMFSELEKADDKYPFTAGQLPYLSKALPRILTDKVTPMFLEHSTQTSCLNIDVASMLKALRFQRNYWKFKHSKKDADTVAGGYCLELVPNLEHGTLECTLSSSDAFYLVWDKVECDYVESGIKPLIPNTVRMGLKLSQIVGLTKFFELCEYSHTTIRLWSLVDDSFKYIRLSFTDNDIEYTLTLMTDVVNSYNRFELNIGRNVQKLCEFNDFNLTVTQNRLSYLKVSDLTFDFIAKTNLTTNTYYNNNCVLLVVIGECAHILFESKVYGVTSTPLPCKVVLTDSAEKINGQDVVITLLTLANFANLITFVNESVIKEGFEFTIELTIDIPVRINEGINIMININSSERNFLGMLVNCECRTLRYLQENYSHSYDYVTSLLNTIR